MLKRTASKKILEVTDKYPVISITGPRQSGKTSLAKELFPNHTYVNLENIAVRQAAEDDPRHFLKLGTGTKMIIDEVQRFPDLLSYMQVEVDEQKIDGQFVITGSENFSLSQNISQSLAGRVANFTLLPLSVAEIDTSEYSLQEATVAERILQGSYPRPLVKQTDPSDFYQDYINTYVERDVRQIKNIGDLSSFQRFLHLLAGRVGQLVNASSLANDIGVSYKTVESWISVLEASYIVYRLQPYYENFGKRVIKTPKIFFYDVGLLCYLLKVTTTHELENHYAYGSIYENFIISELQKNIDNHRKNQSLYFWRDKNGNEVDVLIDKGMQIDALELKVSSTFASKMFKGLNNWLSLDKPQSTDSYVLYTGDFDQKIAGHYVVNWKKFLLELDK